MPSCTALPTIATIGFSRATGFPDYQFSGPVAVILTMIGPPAGHTIYFFPRHNLKANETSVKKRRNDHGPCRTGHTYHHRR